MGVVIEEYEPLWRALQIYHAAEDETRRRQRLMGYLRIKLWSMQPPRATLHLQAFIAREKERLGIAG